MRLTGRRWRRQWCREPAHGGLQLDLSACINQSKLSRVCFRMADRHHQHSDQGPFAAALQAAVPQPATCIANSALYLQERVPEPQTEPEPEPKCALQQAQDLQQYQR